MDVRQPGFFRRFINNLKMSTYDIRRAFREFLAFPTLIILLFLLLAVGAYIFERSQLQINSPIYGFFKSRVFVDAEATSSLLGNIAGSIITVTSITITLLLLIVQQSASNLTTQVFDQFLRRRSNQFYFGFFVGAAVFTLITLATVDEPFNPVFSAVLVFTVTVAALFMLLVLFYATIHQMRPPVILGAIHDHALSARRNQREMIARTRRISQSTAPETLTVFSDQHGFVTRIDLDDLKEATAGYDDVDEIILRISIGGFVAYGSPLAEVKLRAEQDEDALNVLSRRVRGAIQLERSRDLDADPGYGVLQLEQIAWTVLSPSKSNLSPGLQSIYLLHDLLARWSDERDQAGEDQTLAVVYNDDVVGSLIHAFESLAVIAEQSREHQVIAALLEALAGVYPRLPAQWRGEVEKALTRMLPTLQTHAFTDNLEKALVKTVATLQDANRPALAEAFAQALREKAPG